MNLSDFDYPLPEELIAQAPLAERAASRMLVLNRASGEIQHANFRDLCRFLRPGDLLVMNNSRVVKARLQGARASGGAVECFVLERRTENIYECLLRSSARKEGLEFSFGDWARAKVVEKGEGHGTFVVEFTFGSARSMSELMQACGEVPLPPYINRAAGHADEDRYQTVYADKEGSVAAPTAGLHFTPEILREVKSAGVAVAFVSLHVGIGTFQPIKTESLEKHRMHREFFQVPGASLRAIEATKRNGGRVIAIGTTSARTLESYARGFGTAGEDGWQGWTDLFLAPGKEFRIVDAMLTNFHLPKSSLVVMLAAFAGLERIKFAYAAAVTNKYRFFSYGDCMLVI